MKRFLLWLLAALALGTVAGQFMLDDPGYVLATWHDWVFTTSLWAAAVAIAILFFVLLLALGLLASLLNAAGDWRKAREARRVQKARQLTETGLTQYAEADWRKATSTLMKAAELVDVPLLVRLTSARAAEEEGRIDLAGQILREARATAGEAAPLVDVRLASLKLRHGDAAAARMILERMRERFPKHPRALRLLVDVYARLEDWKSLAAVLSTVKPLVPATEWEDLARRAWLGHLQAIADDAGYSSRKARNDALQGAWKSAPAEIRGDDAVIAAFAEILVHHDAVADAQSLLEKTLGSASAPWSDRLAGLYGRLDVEKPAEQLATAEKWLLLRPTNAALLLAAGRISLRNRLWGKARDYFEASVARDATAETCAELVRLYSRLGEDSKAAHYLRRQAELAGSTLPKLPLPTART